MADKTAGPELEKDLKEIKLFEEFSASDYEEWYEQAVASLKGAPFEKKVYTKTYEGFDLKPMYWPDDVKELPHMGSLPGFPPYVRGSEASGNIARPWEICQEISCATTAEFNEIARHDLKKGQTAVNIVLDPPTRRGMDADKADSGEVGHKGLSLSSLEDLQTALNDIDLEKIPVLVASGSTALPMVGLFTALIRAQGKTPAGLKGCVGADPLGELVRLGSLPLALDSAYDAMACLVAWGKDNAPGLQTVMVQGCPYHDAGGSAVQELGFAIATGVEYIRALQNRGLDVNDIAAGMHFSFSIGSHFFMEIAKLRAARVLWAQVINAFGGSEEAQKMTIHGRTSAYTKTIYDPYVNMLRNTAEAFAGVAGGVNSMHVSNFDEAIREPNEFSSRVSRNLQILLREEAHFTHPVDPGGGSWCIETLTDQVARASWELFQEIEVKGGMYQALQDGSPQEAVATTANKRAANLATRKDSLVGTNKYPNLPEPPLEASSPVDYEKRKQERAGQVQAYRNKADSAACSDKLAQVKDALAAASGKGVEAVIEAITAGATLGEVAESLASGDTATPAVEAVRIHRGAESFEALRKKSEEILAKTGSRKKVFLANMGPIPQHKARADFTTGFFEVGGFEVTTNDGFATADEAGQAAVASGAPIVVICSTDKTYPDLVPPLAKSIKEAKPDTVVILAGMPAKEYEEQYREAGMDDCIHIRANCYEMLNKLI